MTPRPFALPLLGLLLSAAAGTALATDEDCSSAPRAQWKSAAEARAATEALGYRAARIEARDGCYEVRAVHRRGKHYDLKFNASDLRLLSRYMVRRGWDRSDAELAAR
jgi:hypothetical protein